MNHPRRYPHRQPDPAEFDRAIDEILKEQSARAAQARQSLQELVAKHYVPGKTVRDRRMKLISMNLEDWQIEAARLVAHARGGSYQEWIRTWVVAGILSESRSKRK